MRSGNFLLSLTFTAPPAPEARLTLLDAQGEAVVEIVIPAAPWEESAGVPEEAMSAFRYAIETIPERFSPGPEEGGGLLLEGSFESAGRKETFSGRYENPEQLSEPLRLLLSSLATLAGEALVGGLSHRALGLLGSWARR